MNHAEIKLFVTDIDGVLTDGAYYVSESSVFKRYNTRDFHGLECLNKEGVKVVFLTASDCNCDRIRIQKAASYAVLHQKVSSKKAWIKSLYIDKKFCKWNEVACIGDDLPDLDLLRAVGLAACPADAIEEVRVLITYRRQDGFVMNRIGGHGCVREFADLVRQQIENK